MLKAWDIVVDLNSAINFSITSSLACLLGFLFFMSFREQLDPIYSFAFLFKAIGRTGFYLWVL